MLFAKKHLRLQAYSFLIAVPLHLIWEVVQISAYDFPETSLMTDVDWLLHS